MISSAKNRELYQPLTLLMLVGMDWPAIHVLGISIRISWLILALLVLVGYIKVQKEYISFLFIAIFLIATIPSTIYSIDVIKSLYYSFWIFFSYFFFYLTSSYYVKKNSQEFTRALIWFSRINILISIIFYLNGYQLRPSSFFYEPSYLSIALIPYCCLVFINQELYAPKKIDFILVLIYLIISESGVFLISIIGSILIGITTKKLKYILPLLIILVLYLIFSNDFNSRYIARLINNLDELNLFQIFERAGNRFPRMLSTYDVAIKNFPFGVGLGNYDLYSNTVDVDLPEFTGEFLTGKGLPGVNIWLDILATAGAIPFFLFALFSCYNILIIFRSNFNIRFKVGIYIITCLIMMIESTFLRGYLWCFYPLLLSRDINIKNKI